MDRVLRRAGARWLAIPGALPHWAKEFEHVPGIVGIARERLGERLERFLGALESAGTDPDGMFVNPLIHRLLLEAGRQRVRRGSGSRQGGRMTSAPTVLTQRQTTIAVSGLMTGMLLAALDQTIVATALKTIVETFDGLNHYALVVTAYLLPATASTLLYGRISDLYGRRSVFRFAIAVFLLGSMLAGFAQSMTQLVAGRAVQGLGAGGLDPDVHHHRRHRPGARARAVPGLPRRSVGPRSRRRTGPRRRVLRSRHDPRPRGVALDVPREPAARHARARRRGCSAPAPVVRLQSEDCVRSNDRLWSEDQRPQIDYLGAGLVFASVSALVLALAWSGPEHGWAHPTTVALAVAGVVLVALLVVCESRVAEPILPLRLFTNRVFATTSAVAGIVGVGMFGTVVMMPLYLQIITGTSATGAGSRLLPFVFGYIATSIVSGRQISRTGSYRAFPIAGTALTALGLGLLSLIDASTPGWLLALYLLAVGGGLGLTIQPLLVAVQSAVEPSDMGIATSANVFFRSFGSTVGTALFAAIFTSRLGENLEHTFATLTTSDREALAGIDARSLMANAERIKTLPIDLQQQRARGLRGGVPRGLSPGGGDRARRHGGGALHRPERSASGDGGRPRRRRPHSGYNHLLCEVTMSIPYRANYHWHNHGKNLSSTVARYYEPTSNCEVQQIVKEARREWKKSARRGR